MSATSRREVLEQACLRYGGRGKVGRSRLLDEICVLCGYERKYASKRVARPQADRGRKQKASRRIALGDTRNCWRACSQLARSSCR